MTLLRRTGLQRRTELTRTPLRRKKATQRVAAAKRTVGRQKARRYTGPTHETRVVVWARAKGRCERCGRDLHGGYPTNVHHRRPRGAGGTRTPWINDVTNLLQLCGTATSPDSCHRYVETHRAEAYEAGWLIPSGHHPAQVPVLIHHQFLPVYLTEDGGYADEIGTA